MPRRLFGALVEHMGRGVYGGIFEPGHPSADEGGFRRDLLDLVRELGVTTARYPGGNFASGYCWEDGVGPRDRRPSRLDLAWRVTESNAFGTDEFIDWCRLAEIEPMVTLNLGTRGATEALDLREYANHAAGTELAERRIANGHARPHDIRIWCLGNELDGPWQLGHRTAVDYARLAADTARAMRMADPSLELVACGSSGPAMPTFGAWEEAVLRGTNGLVDAVSLHYYADPDAGSAEDHLVAPVELERYICDVAAIVDEVGATTSRGERVWLSVDEWNVWYLRRHMAATAPDGFPPSRRLCEDDYTAADAVVVGGLLLVLLKHVDRVRAACLAQLVNTIAPIHAESSSPPTRAATFHPFALTGAAALGRQVHLVDVGGPALSTSRWGSVPAVDAVAVVGGGDRAGEGAGAVLLVNRDPAQAVRVELDLGALGATAAGAVAIEASQAGGPPANAAPSAVPVEASGTTARLDLAPASWVRVRLEPR